MIKRIDRNKKLKESVDLNKLADSIYEDFEDYVNFADLLDVIIYGSEDYDFESLSDYLGEADFDEFWENHWIDIIEDTCEAFTKGTIKALKDMGKI